LSRDGSLSMECVNVELKVLKIMSFVALVFGVLMIIGTKSRWMILVNPPEEWTGIYSHSKLKKYSVVIS